LAIVLFVFRLTASGYPFGILVIELSVLWLTASGYPFGILVIVLSVLRLTASGYLFDILVIVLSVLRLTLLVTPLIFWLLYCLLGVTISRKSKDRQYNHQKYQRGNQKP
jgi:hypothetical protein